MIVSMREYFIYIWDHIYTKDVVTSMNKAVYTHYAVHTVNVVAYMNKAIHTHKVVYTSLWISIWFHEV